MTYKCYSNNYHKHTEHKQNSVNSVKKTHNVYTMQEAARTWLLIWPVTIFSRSDIVYHVYVPSVLWRCSKAEVYRIMWPLKIHLMEISLSWAHTKYYYYTELSSRIRRLIVKFTSVLCYNNIYNKCDAFQDCQGSRLDSWLSINQSNWICIARPTNSGRGYLRLFLVGSICRYISMYALAEL